MKLAICTATMQPNQNIEGSIQCHPGDISTWTCMSHDFTRIYTQYNTPDNNLGVVGSYQKLYENSDEELLAYLHDDVICREEGWNERVIKEFEDPNVGVCGFGGALQHGDPSIYKTPYQLQQLRRSSYRSNVDDAEIHGERFTGSCEVAVLDGFALVVRREFLDRMGGWKVIAGGCDFYCYDYAICAMAHRFGYRVRMVGIRCHHRGGGTSVINKGLSATSQEAYDLSHKWYYEEFRDVMPWRCK